MSRINDALKRAQAAQQSPAPPGNNPQWQPPAPEQSATRGIGLAVPFFFALIALLGLFYLWQIRQKRAAQNQAPAEPQLLATANPVQETASPSRAPVKTSPSANPKATVTPRVEEKPVVPAPVRTSLPAQPATASAPPPAPEPPPLKLQAVLFSGQSSSAMVSGQTVMIGDSVGEYRVTAINRRSVTLVKGTGTQTKILTLTQ